MARDKAVKYIIGVSFIILATLTAITISANLGRRPIDVFDEPTHNKTLWVQPENYTYYLDIEFYSSQEDAWASQNRYVGSTSAIRPFSEEKRESVLYGIPKTIDSLWLRIACFEEGENEDLAEFIVLMLTVGTPLYFRIEGHDFTLLITPVVE
ncbi:MAG: hypothetical protein ACFFC0_04390 [Promethearchaeota archaeon]